MNLRAIRIYAWAALVRAIVHDPRGSLERVRHALHEALLGRAIRDAQRNAPVVPFTPAEREMVTEAMRNPQGWQSAEEFAAKARGPRIASREARYAAVMKYDERIRLTGSSERPPEPVHFGTRRPAGGWDFACGADSSHAGVTQRFVWTEVELLLDPERCAGCVVAVSKAAAEGGST